MNAIFQADLEVRVVDGRPVFFVHNLHAINQPPAWDLAGRIANLQNQQRVQVAILSLNKKGEQEHGSTQNR